MSAHSAVVSSATVLTHSALKAYRACARRYELSYIHRYRSVEVPKPLVFGTAVHRALEAFWRAYQSGSKEPQAIALEVLAANLSGYDLALARPMVIAYAAVWMVHKWEVLAVEVKFRMPMKHPDGRVSQRFVLEGKIDLVLRGPDGIVRLVEHKTCGVDPGEGSSYRRRLSKDEQVTLYMAGAESLGIPAERITYDVLRKPKIKPLKATPEEDRNYTKAKYSKARYDKKTGALIAEERLLEPSRLYAGQREKDETVEEFEARVREVIVASPDAYIQRIPLERTPQARERFHLNVWNQAGHLAKDLDDGHFGENSDSCLPNGCECQFAPHCLEGKPLNDPYVFKRMEVSHPELQEGAYEDDDNDVDENW